MGEGRGIYSVAMFHVVASEISLATSFFLAKRTAHILPLPASTPPAYAGLRFGSAAARRVFLIAKNIDFNCPYKLKQAIYDLLRLIL